MNACTHRKTLNRSKELIQCSHPNVHARDNIVPVKNCLTCRWCDNGYQVEPPSQLPLSEADTGPGTQLKELLAEHGYTAKGCGCNSTAAKMNRLGVDGCRREIDSLASEIVANASKQSVTITVEMARFAIEEACRRVDATAQQSPAQQSLPESAE